MTTQSPYAERLASIPVTERRIDVQGASTRYWEYGPADAERAIVVVHGFRGDHHGLEPVIAHLPSYRIISPDLPGFGNSDPLAAAPHSIDGYAAWLSAFVDRLGLAERPVILGHSFGSIVASAAVAQGLSTPRMILINPIAAPALAGPRGILTRLAIFYYWLAAALPEKLGFALLRNRVIVRIMSMAMAKTRDPALRRWIHNQHDLYFSAFGNRDVVLEAFRASVSSDVSEFAGAVAQPTLLIAADRDDITPIVAQERLATLFPDAKLVILKGVGHLIHYEKPAPAAEAIRRFLGEPESSEAHESA